MADVPALRLRLLQYDTDRDRRFPGGSRGHLRDVQLRLDERDPPVRSLRSGADAGLTGVVWNALHRQKGLSLSHMILSKRLYWTLKQDLNPDLASRQIAA